MHTDSGTPANRLFVLFFRILVRSTLFLSVLSAPGFASGPSCRELFRGFAVTSTIRSLAELAADPETTKILFQVPDAFKAEVRSRSRDQEFRVEENGDLRVGELKYTSRSNVQGIINRGILDPEGQSSQVVKLYAVAVGRSRTEDQFARHLAGGLIGMSVGGPKILRFGKWKTRDPKILSQDPGADADRFTEFKSEFYYIAMENLSPSKPAISLKEIKQNAQKHSLLQAISPKQWSEAGRLFVETVMTRVVPMDMDILFIGKDEARWIDCDYWTTAPSADVSEVMKRIVSYGKSTNLSSVEMNASQLLYRGIVQYLETANHINPVDKNKILQGYRHM